MGEHFFNHWKYHVLLHVNKFPLRRIALVNKAFPLIHIDWLHRKRVQQTQAHHLL
jgi:hypothetical protein